MLFSGCAAKSSDKTDKDAQSPESTEAAETSESADENLSKPDIIRSIDVAADADSLSYWTEDSETAQALIDYVKSVTDEESEDFIPAERRIAVFDMDGTFMGERTPYYTSYVLYLHRMLDDPDYTPSVEERAFAESFRDAAAAGKVTSEMSRQQQESLANAFAGLTDEEYYDYVKKVLETDVPGLTNVKYQELFYLPMVEVMSYLNANDFTVYVVSAAERRQVRAFVLEVLPIETNHIIGTDDVIEADHQGDEEGLDYTYVVEDELIYTGEVEEETGKTNKVTAIATEIGMQPVLAFGNSNGDASMLNYTLDDNPYKSMSFVVLCDDTDRENGNPDKAASMQESAEKYGWTTISMKNDFATIYGDDVVKE